MSKGIYRYSCSNGGVCEVNISSVPKSDLPDLLAWFGLITGQIARQVPIDEPEQSTPLITRLFVPNVVPAQPCGTCGGTKTIIDPKSVRRTLAYGDPMESIPCPDCSASSQEPTPPTKSDPA